MRRKPVLRQTIDVIRLSAMMYVVLWLTAAFNNHDWFLIGSLLVLSAAALIGIELGIHRLGTYRGKSRAKNASVGWNPIFLRIIDFVRLAAAVYAFFWLWLHAVKGYHWLLYCALLVLALAIEWTAELVTDCLSRSNDANLA